MLQGVYTGKAQETYSALSLRNKVDIIVKSAVLKTYELVPEAYWQCVRDMRKTEHHSHVEFVQDLVVPFLVFCNRS